MFTPPCSKCGSRNVTEVLGFGNRSLLGSASNALGKIFRGLSKLASPTFSWGSHTYRCNDCGNVFTLHIM